jgi:hypothetical protein
MLNLLAGMLNLRARMRNQRAGIFGFLKVDFPVCPRKIRNNAMCARFFNFHGASVRPNIHGK